MFGGFEIGVRPESSKKKLTLKSHVKVETKEEVLDGDVYDRPMGEWRTITMEVDKIKDPSEVLSLTVQRYNELNHILKRRYTFFTKLLGKTVVNLNSWQKYFYHWDHTDIPHHQSKITYTKSHFNIGRKKLNQSQISALKNSDAPLSYIIGPPGTGKTLILSKITEKFIKSGQSVLLVSETNQSVRRMYQSLQENNIAPEVHKDLIISRSHFMYNKNRYSSKPHTDNKTKFGRIVLCTISRAIQLLHEGLMHSSGPNGRSLLRTVLIMDEASLTTKLTLYELLPLLLYFRHIILAGDPAQRSPYSPSYYVLRSILELMQARVAKKDDFIKHSFYMFNLGCPRISVK